MPSTPHGFNASGEGPRGASWELGTGYAKLP